MPALPPRPLPSQALAHVLLMYVRIEAAYQKLPAQAGTAAEAGGGGPRGGESEGLLQREAEGFIALVSRFEHGVEICRGVVDLLLARAPSERRDPQLVRLARLVSDVRPGESGPGQSRPAEG
jgi:hypothetical protein